MTEHVQPAPGPRDQRPLLIGAMTLLALVMVFLAPMALDYYTVNILIRACLYAVAALTVDMLWGYTGILTFAQGTFFGIGAYAVGLVFTHYGFSPTTAVLAFLGALVAAALVAAIVGWFAFWHGASPLYAGVVTLVLPIIVVQLLYSGGTLTGSSSGLVGFEAFDLEIETWFYIAGTLAVLTTATLTIVVRSDVGRVLVAIRENETRCSYLGINAPRIKIVLFTAMAMVAAMAGYVFTCFGMVVAPEMTGLVFGTELIIYTALGGRGTLVGPLLGTIGIDGISSYLSGELPYLWKLIVGTVFVAVIILLPRGLIPTLGSLLGGFRRRETARVSGLRLRRVEPKGFASQSGAMALAISGLDRRYGSLKVLSGVELTVGSGELLSVVGPNGAGKTTLMRCISDGHERTAGHVAINGNGIGRLSPHRIVELGLGRSFQNTSLFETLTVADCLRLARTRWERPHLFTRSREICLPEAALRVVEATGLDAMLDHETRNLSHGMKRALELSMVIALEPSVLLLDEPTAGLTKPERMMVGSILVDLCRSESVSVVIIEHDLDFVREISSRVVVLHQGAVLIDGTVDEVVSSELVHAVYAGKGAAGQDERAPA
ncbi:Vitamin B12 import ATP-binding protein BtuD [Starkeya nomas]|uniref:Vitamin B12 import ATP-binding protein BtuD n=1 Tax=Starkeya nomas TaxID=2666134 RepID=A0A5S9R3I9_9HYPH|nr:ATP-binding cassette domain-containing protein [Starkeya nomas]CAA0128676.1 Vitamin B12 import ATP-binding protein BtuD [Starkeya nomas]